MAIAGPFGSYEYAPFLYRLLFWTAVLALALVVAAGVRVTVWRLTGSSAFWRTAPLVGLVVSGLLALPLHSAALTCIALPGQPAPGRVEFAAFLFFLSLSTCALRQAFKVTDEVRAPESAPAEPVTPGPPRLMQRIEPALRGLPVRMSMRDHYVDLVTEAGTASILMRFSDAIAEMEGADGLQVHRSHWVAASAVRGAERGGGRTFLVLSDGSRVPVSRTYRAALDARGLI